MSLISNLYDDWLSWLNEWSYDRCKERGIIIDITREQHQINMARSELADWDFRDDEFGDRDWRDDLTDAEVIAGINQHYEGGWEQFLIDGEL